MKNLNIRLVVLFCFIFLINEALASNISVGDNVSACYNSCDILDNNQYKGKAGDIGICKVESPVSEYCGYDTLVSSVWIKN